MWWHLHEQITRNHRCGSIEELVKLTMAWLDERDPKIDVIFAPYETYLDDLLGVKTSYGAAILVRSEAESQNLAKYQKWLPDLQDSLPLGVILSSVRTVIFIAVALDREPRIASSLHDHVDPIRSCLDLRNNTIAERRECDEYLALEPGLATVDEVLFFGLTGDRRFVKMS